MFSVRDTRKMIFWWEVAGGAREKYKCVLLVGWVLEKLIFIFESNDELQDLLVWCDLKLVWYCKNL